MIYGELEEEKYKLIIPFLLLELITIEKNK
jgi:hypothetical protein